MPFKCLRAFIFQIQSFSANKYLVLGENALKGFNFYGDI
jgi:hypothetical protein